jgi:GNAT superfamily N-acetyltransferase
MPDLTIRPLAEADLQTIAAAFAATGGNSPAGQCERYLDEQRRGERDVLVAFLEDAFAGYLTVVWRSGYIPFREAGIPEIVDFNVVPGLRRRGIGPRLMEAAERLIAGRSAVVGIGVGLDPDYGAAQRLYVKRGYVPDGRGLTAGGRPVRWGETVTVDDGLNLHLTKDLSGLRASSEG